MSVFVSTGSVERETLKGCAVPCQCLKYIYIHIHIHMYTARDDDDCLERWRGERCGALPVLEVYIYISTYRARAVRCVVSA